MMFSELYSSYYNAVACILKEAVKGPVSPDDIRRIAAEKAFGESPAEIEEALRREKWQLLKADGTTPLVQEPEMPLTLLQKRWLKSVSGDPRIRLFDISIPDYDVEPLFTQDDICVFDRNSDGDDYSDPSYIDRFRTIVSAMKQGAWLKIRMISGKGREIGATVFPEYLEYSEKDDRFRLITSGHGLIDTVVLSRLTECVPCSGGHPEYAVRKKKENRTAVFELTDERNALERVLLHFAHFEKQAEKLSERNYRVTLSYDPDDETEILIRLLSFGPMVRVTAPEELISQIRERLARQIRLLGR